MQYLIHSPAFNNVEMTRVGGVGVTSAPVSMSAENGGSERRPRQPLDHAIDAARSSVLAA